MDKVTHNGHTAVIHEYGPNIFGETGWKIVVQNPINPNTRHHFDLPSEESAKIWAQWLVTEADEVARRTKAAHVMWDEAINHMRHCIGEK